MQPCWSYCPACPSLKFLQVLHVGVLGVPCRPGSSHNVRREGLRYAQNRARYQSHSSSTLPPSSWPTPGTSLGPSPFECSTSPAIQFFCLSWRPCLRLPTHTPAVALPGPSPPHFPAPTKHVPCDECTSTRMPANNTTQSTEVISGGELPPATYSTVLAGYPCILIVPSSSLLRRPGGKWA